MFTDRREAGRQLATLVASRRPHDPLVLALPRGGVPVADEVARRLDAPLDIILVRKIGAPQQPELAIGALVEGDSGELVLNERIVALLHVPDAYIDSERARQWGEIEKRRQIYRDSRPRLSVTGKTVILVDDGVATGATVRAALKAVRRGEPERLMLAVPVAPTETVRSLAELVDELLCLEQPTLFSAVGQFYEDFRQLRNDEVRTILDAAEARRTKKGPPPPKAPSQPS